MGVVPLLIFFNEASINTFLHLALDFFNLFLWSGIGTTPHSRLFKLGMQIRSEFNLNSPNSLRIGSHREFVANSA